MKQNMKKPMIDPVGRVDVYDNHVHVQMPAPGLVLEVQGVHVKASRVWEPAPGDGTGLPLET